ncbi:MAG: heavy-metal-associated domain-containing protein [Rhodospirillales bacterium]|nr:heavy-metal-associated domain-containing protein [Rhodospirillales bacterium]
MSETYRVTGMTCDGCARAVANAIKTAAPAASVTVDLAAGRVRVDGNVDNTRIAQAVEEAGFGFAGPAV